MNIQYLQHKKINFRKWDDCIRNSINGNLYDFSWYLDIVSEGWDALILSDYETVMPLTHQKKLGVSYILQPFFSQQLGVFSTQRITSEVVSEFIITIIIYWLPYFFFFHIKRLIICMLLQPKKGKKKEQCFY